MWRADNKSTETNQAQVSLISGTAAFIYWGRVRIEIIYPNWGFYCLINSLFVVRMRIIISLGLRPREWYNFPHPISKQWFYWAIKSQFGIYYFLIKTFSSILLINHYFNSQTFVTYGHISSSVQWNMDMSL
jgi:hypothetical protein